MDFSFKGADKKAYNLSELTLGDLTDSFPLFVQFYPYEQFKKMETRIPKEQYEAQSSKLLNECSAKSCTINSPEVKAFLDTMEGTIYLSFLSMRKEHPTITLEQVKEILTPAIFPEVSVKVAVLSGFMGEETAKKKLEEIQSLMKQ